MFDRRFFGTLGRWCLVWKYVKTAQWGINRYSVVWVLMHIQQDLPSKEKLQCKRLVFLLQRYFCWNLISIKSDDVYTYSLWSSVRIPAVRKKVTKPTNYWLDTAQGTQAATVWRAQRSFCRVGAIWTIPVLLSLMTYCIACLAARSSSWISLVQFWSQVNKCNYSCLSSEVMFFNIEWDEMPFG